MALLLILTIANCCVDQVSKPYFLKIASAERKVGQIRVLGLFLAKQVQGYSILMFKNLALLSASAQILPPASYSKQQGTEQSTNLGNHGKTLTVARCLFPVPSPEGS